MSRDETLKGHLARLREASRLHHEHQRRAVENVRGDMELARQARTEAQRLHDEAHRAREAERARRKGKKPLDAATIAQAAVAIADAQGLDEVSMRKIAAVLGSGTMSLYHYIKTKEDLLAAMDDIIMGEILVPGRELKGSWRQNLSAIARYTRDAYRRHPWALTLQSEGGQPGPNGLRHVEQSMAALEATGLQFEQKLSMTIIVDDFVFGHSLRAASPGIDHTSPDEMLAPIAEYMHAHLESGEFPVLKGMIGDTPLRDLLRRLASSFRPDEWFETGLESILDGLANRYNLDQPQ